MTDSVSVKLNSSSIVIYTTSDKDLGKYAMKLKGSLINGLYSEVSFILTIKAPCSKAIVFTPGNKQYSLFLGDDDFLMPFPTFWASYSTALCGDWKYFITDKSGSSYDPNIITASSDLGYIQVNTKNLKTIVTNPYTIKVRGYMGDYTSIAQSITIDITFLRVDGVKTDSLQTPKPQNTTNATSSTTSTTKPT